MPVFIWAFLMLSHCESVSAGALSTKKFSPAFIDFTAISARFEGISAHAINRTSLSLNICSRSQAISTLVKCFFTFESRFSPFHNFFLWTFYNLPIDFRCFLCYTMDGKKKGGPVRWASNHRPFQKRFSNETFNPSRVCVCERNKNKKFPPDTKQLRCPTIGRTEGTNRISFIVSNPQKNIDSSWELLGSNGTSSSPWKVREPFAFCERITQQQWEFTKENKSIASLSADSEQQKVDQWKRGLQRMLDTKSAATWPLIAV